MKTLELPAPWPDVAFWSTDGSSLAIAEGDVCRNNFLVERLDETIMQQTQISDICDNYFVIGDHEVLASGYANSPVVFKIFSTRSGEVVFTLTDPEPRYHDDASASERHWLSPDRTLLAVGYPTFRQSKFLYIYDTRSWRKVAVFTVPSVSGPEDVAFSADDKTIAVLGTFSPLVWGVFIMDAGTGRLIRVVHLPADDDGWGLAFSPDGTNLAISLGTSSDEQNVSAGQEVIKVASGSVWAKLPPPPCGHDSDGLYTGCFPAALLWDPKGAFLILDNYADRLDVWAPGLAGGGTISISREDGGGRGEAISPDGKRLAVGDGDDVVIYRIDR